MKVCSSVLSVEQLCKAPSIEPCGSYTHDMKPPYTMRILSFNKNLMRPLFFVTAKLAHTKACSLQAPPCLPAGSPGSVSRPTPQFENPLNPLIPESSSAPPLPYERAFPVSPPSAYASPQPTTSSHAHPPPPPLSIQSLSAAFVQHVLATCVTDPESIAPHLTRLNEVT